MSKRPVRFIEISSEMFERIEERNRKVAEIQFAQLTIDMKPADATAIRDHLIERLIEREWERIGDRIGAYIDEKNGTGLPEAAAALAEQGG
jgi:hypothetical protein